MLENNPAARWSWRQKLSGLLPGRSGSAGAFSSVGAGAALGGLDGAASAIRGYRLSDADGERRSPRARGEHASTALSRWREETGKVEAFICAANTRVAKQLADIQASIILAQDNLSDDDELGRQALKRKTDCAEKYHRAVCQFNRLADNALCLTALTPQLIKIIELQTPRDVASIMNMASACAPVAASGKQTWITQQLMRIRRELVQGETRPEHIPAHQLSACVASLNAVVKLLTQHIDEVGRELHQLAVVIDELDRFIVAP